MSLVERNDFFVERQLRVISETNESIHILCATIKNKEIDTRMRDYIPSKDYLTITNISRIRIPAALFVTDEVDDPTVYKALIGSYRKQVGTHLMVSSEGYLCYVYTNLDANQNYLVSSLRYINDVYPCYVNRGESGHQLCLGLRFTTKLTEGFRSFSRTEDNQCPSGGVFDLTEDVLYPKHLKYGRRSRHYRKLFPKSHPKSHYVLYVCAGAKLVVEDDRFFELSNDDISNQGKKMNTSLFQSGSLILFIGHIEFQTSYSLITNEKGEEMEALTHIKLGKAVKIGLIKPEDGLFQNWFQERGLDKSTTRVIFLGHNYSVHNSICWRLRINYLKPEHNQPSAILSVPEGGRIVDIQDWGWGMAELYWRHCFERLYEKVVMRSVSKAYNQNKWFHFFIPTVRGINTFYWERKILGVGVNFNSWDIKLRYKYKDQSSGRIPPYYEQYTDWIETVTPFAPPLHPPIYCERQYYYLPYKTCPEYLTNQLVNINGKLFRIKYKEGVEEYRWSDPQRVSFYQNKNFSTDERVGVDQYVYTKYNSVVGRKMLFYFELYSETSIDLQTKQWIEEQNSSDSDVRPTPKSNRQNIYDLLFPTIKESQN